MDPTVNPLAPESTVTARFVGTEGALNVDESPIALGIVGSVFQFVEVAQLPPASGTHVEEVASTSLVQTATLAMTETPRTNALICVLRKEFQPRSLVPRCR